MFDRPAPPQTVPVFILTRNRVSMAAQCYQQVCRLNSVFPVIIDNGSTWGPMVEWLEGTDRVTGCAVRCHRNLGAYGLWDRTDGPSLLDSFFDAAREESGPVVDQCYYVVTDDDLDLSGVPADVLSVLRAGLDATPDAIKCGLSLEIDDIPDKYPLAKEVREDQAKYWNTFGSFTSGSVVLDPKQPRMREGLPPVRYFRANIDTTFAMYRVRDIDRIGPRAHGPGLRTDRPYTARHLPWYKGFEDMTAEDWYYLKHSETYTYWTHLLQQYCRARGIELAAVAPMLGKDGTTVCHAKMSNARR